MISREEVREALTGPVAVLSTVFSRDGSIDYAGLRDLIDSQIAGGSKTILLTHGDTLLSLLTDDEIAEITKVAVDHAGGRAMVVAADGTWWTSKAIEFADYCREAGVDVLMVRPPVSPPEPRATPWTPLSSTTPRWRGICRSWCPRTHGRDRLTWESALSLCFGTR